VIKRKITGKYYEQPSTKNKRALKLLCLVSLSPPAFDILPRHPRPQQRIPVHEKWL
jgi:hypothetical protein